MVDVEIPPDQLIVPKLEFGNSLENMTPVLPAGVHVAYIVMACLVMAVYSHGLHSYGLYTYDRSI